MKLSLTSIFKGYYKYCQCGCKELIPCVNNGRFLRYKRKHYQKSSNKNDKQYNLLYKPYYKYSNSNGYVRKHRYIMYIYLSILENKPTYIEDFDVHHKNKNRKDNRIENLDLLTRSDHQSFHAIKDKSNRFCNLCKSNNTTESLKNGKYYDVWYNDINGFLCRPCKTMIEYFKKRLCVI
jgi:hypothetical protein